LRRALLFEQAERLHYAVMAAERVRLLNQTPARREGRYVLYWIQANRRTEFNHALIHAAQVANDLELPLLCYEELDCAQPFASDRSHTFHLEGVPETEAALKKLGAGYIFHLRRRRADPPSPLPGLLEEAAAAVTDDHPTLSATPDVEIPFSAVDSSCVVPMSLIPAQAYAAYSIRPKIQRLLPIHQKATPGAVLRRRFLGEPPATHTVVRQEEIASLVADSEIDHSVAPSLTHRGSRKDAEKHLDRFLKERLRRYARSRNEPSEHATSELSPYLHCGLISPLEVALETESYALEHKLMAGEFLEELIVRRELAFNFARHAAAPPSLGSLPEWARKTLQEHRRDRRPHSYTASQFRAAETHDALWNATQKEMLLRGKIHGYYRMYWGKKIIEWSRAPEEALETMTYIHDRYALDGRDPNTYANILWCFGLHDRPWPERPIFGKVRYLSLEGMKRKTNVQAYLQEIETLERTGRDPFRIQ